MIPLIVAGIGTAVGAIAKISAAVDNDDAKEANKKANRIIEESKQLSENAKAECQDSMMLLAYEKREVLEGTVSAFVPVFKQFLKDLEKTKDVNFTDNADLMEISKFKKNELVQMQNLTTEVREMSGADIVSDISGIGVAGGIVASTVLKTAFTASLGAFVAPVFAISSIFSASEAAENLEKAKGNLAKANEFKDECETYAYMANGIRDRCDLFYKAIYCINEYWFKNAVMRMSEIVRQKQSLRYFFKKVSGRKIYDEKETAVVAMTVKLAQLLSVLIKTNILQADGKTLSEESEYAAGNAEAMLLEYTGAEGISRADTDSSIENHKIFQKQAYQNPKRNRAYISSLRKQGGLYVPSIAASVFGWIFCVWFAFLGLCVIVAGDFIPGTIIAAAGIFACPKVNPHFKMKWKIIIGMILALTGFFFVSEDESADSAAETEKVQLENVHPANPLETAEIHAER